MFEKTRAAVAKWDSARDERNRRWETCETLEEMDEIEKSQNEELKEFRDAFFEDTKHTNSREHCDLVHPDGQFIRDLLMNNETAKEPNV